MTKQYGLMGAGGLTRIIIDTGKPIERGISGDLFLFVFGGVLVFNYLLVYVWSGRGLNESIEGLRSISTH